MLVGFVADYLVENDRETEPAKCHQKYESVGAIKQALLVYCAYC